MIPNRNILIVDDDDRLRHQLVRLTTEVITDWNIIEADNYEDAIQFINNNELDILVCDLFLEPDEDRNDQKNHIPSGIQVAKQVRRKKPNSFIIIVSSNLDSLFNNNHKLLDYIDAGVNIFFDRNVNPYEKFSYRFQYQLQMVSKSIIFSSDSVSKLWEIQNIQNVKSYCSYWILICDIDETEQHDLIGDYLILGKKLSRHGASILLINIHDQDKISYLIEHDIVNDITDINDYPILLIGESPDMQSNIQIESWALEKIKNNGYLTKFFNSINNQLNYKDIVSIREYMKSENYWTRFLNIKENLQKINITHANSSNTIIINFTDSINRYIKLHEGNYNENIKGNYYEQNQINK